MGATTKSRTKANKVKKGGRAAAPSTADGAEWKEKLRGPVRQTVTRSVPKGLAPSERLTALENLAAAEGELKKLEDEKAQLTKDLAADVKSAKKKVRAASDFLETGEHESVECWSEYDPGTNEVVVTRKDTGEELERRAPTDEDKQAELPMDGEGDDDGDDE